MAEPAVFVASSLFASLPASVNQLWRVMDLAPDFTPAPGVEEDQPGTKPFGRSVVLVIDDDESSSSTLVSLLRHSGFEAKSFVTGADALSTALTAPPDAVLLDLHLAPDDIPGFLVLQSLRGKYPDLPIIAITGWYLADEEEARALGVTDYLFKPLDDSSVAASLHAALSGPRQRLASSGLAEHAGSSTRPRVAEPGTDENSSRQLADAENAFIRNRLPTLVRRMRHSFPTVWADVITEQVEDTLLELLAKVKRGIWPTRDPLDAHLRRAAWRNVRDQMRAANRRAANEARYAIEDPWRTDADAAKDSAALEMLLTLVHTESERQALHRWIEGEGPSRIAEALGLSDAPVAEQLREVKRFTDRLKKRARRRGSG